MLKLLPKLTLLSLLILASTLCRGEDLYESTAARYHLSARLLRSIAEVESQRYPWAVNINQESFHPASPKQAVRLIHRVQKKPWLLRLDYAEGPHRMFFSSGRDARLALVSVQKEARKLGIEHPTQWEIRKLDARSVDIGLMQINWKFHGRHFDSMLQLFDPATNVDYAARYLKSLLQEYGNLEKAVAFYHSNTQEYQDRYLEYFRNVYDKQLSLPHRS